MTVTFHLIHAASKEAGVGAGMEAGWVQFIPADESELGIDEYIVTAPEGCGLSEDEVKAYTQVAVWGDPDPDTGEQELITPPILAEGSWWLGWTSDDALIPEGMAHYVVSSWDEVEPMVLPDGVVKIEPLLSGVIVG